MRRPFGTAAEFPGEGIIRVDEFRDDGVQVIRAELPGIDPEKDVEVTVHEGMVHIVAERRAEEQSEERGYTRHEMRYGRLTRTLPLAEGTTESDITATYKDGILEIRVPVPEVQQAPEPIRVPIAKS